VQFLWCPESFQSLLPVDARLSLLISLAGRQTGSCAEGHNYMHHMLSNILYLGRKATNKVKPLVKLEMALSLSEVVKRNYDIHCSSL
jgi:hypothetical protein